MGIYGRSFPTSGGTTCTRARFIICYVIQNLNTKSFVLYIEIIKRLWNYASLHLEALKFSIPSIIVDGSIFLLIYPHEEELKDDNAYIYNFIDKILYRKIFYWI